MRTKVPAKAAVKRHYEEPKPALPRVSWTSLPDSILARIYCALLPVTKPLQTKHPHHRPNSKVKRAMREAREERQAKQLKFKLVCKAWLQGAGHGISKGHLCKIDLTKGQLPAGLHLRFGGIQILTLTQVNLGTSGFQELGSLKQLQQLTLSDIDSHFAAIGLAVVQHYKMNISRAGKLKHAEADRTKVQLMAALPYSDKSNVTEYVFISQHSMACYQRGQAGSAIGSTAGQRPFTCGSDSHGHRRQSPFAMLRSLTSLTLHQYPLACLPAQDLAGMSLLTNLKSLVLKELWGVTVPYDTLTALSSLTSLSIDTSQSQDSLQLLPAVTSLHSLSIYLITPHISEAWPFGPQYSALQSLSRLKLCDVDGVTNEQLQSLTAFAALQHLVLKGLDQGDDSGKACWSKSRSWHELQGLTRVMHLELVDICHPDNIFDSLSCLTQLTHLCLRSPNNLYQSPLGEGLMLLAPLPNLEYLYCKFMRFSVRSALLHDLAAQFRQVRRLPIRHLEIDIEEVLDWNEEVDSDDINSDLAYERAQEQEGQRMIQEQYEADYDSDDRRMHSGDRDLYNEIMREYY